MPGCKVKDLVVVIKAGSTCDPRGVTFVVKERAFNPQKPDIIFWRPTKPVLHPVTGQAIRFLDSSLQPIRGSRPKVTARTDEQAPA